MTERLSRAHLLVLFLWLAACGVFAYWDTLRLPYALDDLDHLHAIADMRMGRTSFLRWVFLANNEHIMPVLRLFYLAATFVSRLEATFFRVILVLVQAAGGLACGLLVFYHGGSRLGMWAAGTVYAGLVGFAGSVVWLPANANFLLSAVALSFALALLCSPGGNRKMTWMACWALVALGAGAFTGVVFAAVVIPAYGLVLRPALGFSRRVVVLTYVGFAVVFPLAARWILVNFYNAGFQFRPEARHAMKGLWIAYTAPLRYANAWGLHSSHELSSMVKLSAVLWLLLALSLFLLPPRQRRLLACLWAGPVALALLIAAARNKDTLLNLFLTDRYYYYFLLPLSVHGGFLLARLGSALALRLRFGPGLAVILLLGVAGPLLAGSHARLRETVLWTVFDFHARAFASGRTLLRIIASHASPLVLVDGPIPFDGVHKDAISLACLFFTQYPQGLPGVRLTSSRLDPENARIQNLIFDEWSEKVGVPASPVCVEDGGLQDIGAVSWIDFGKGSFERAVVSGFHAREGKHRWTSSSASVRLIPAGSTLVIRAYAPIELLRSKWPHLEALQATVQVNGSPAGAIQVSSAEEQEFHVPVPAALLSRSSGRPEVVVTLVTAMVWHGVDLKPPLADERHLGLAVTAIGFPSGLQANPCAARVAGN